MDIDTIKYMIETRLTIAEESGNYTKRSLLFELLKLAEENKEMKRKLEEYGKTN